MTNWKDSDNDQASYAGAHPVKCVARLPLSPPSKKTIEESAKIEPNWAKYNMCPVCRQAMTMKARKIEEVALNVFTHKQCAAIFRRSVKAGIERAAAEAKEE